MDTRNAAGHSADVRISLAVNGDVLKVAQLGPDFLILRETADHPPGEGVIRMSIDGVYRQWRVELIDGIVASQQETRTAILPANREGPSAK